MVPPAAAAVLTGVRASEGGKNERTTNERVSKLMYDQSSLVTVCVYGVVLLTCRRVVGSE